jgi:hypothetical protein
MPHWTEDAREGALLAVSQPVSEPGPRPLHFSTARSSMAWTSSGARPSSSPTSANVRGFPRSSPKRSRTTSTSVSSSVRRSAAISAGSWTGSSGTMGLSLPHSRRSSGPPDRSGYSEPRDEPTGFLCRRFPDALGSDVRVGVSQGLGTVAPCWHTIKAAPSSRRGDRRRGEPRGQPALCRSWPQPGNVLRAFTCGSRRFALQGAATSTVRRLGRRHGHGGIGDLVEQ